MNSALKFISVSTLILLMGLLSKSTSAQFGDYSVQIKVDNSSETFSHFTNVVFANEFFGSTPSNGWDVCCDAYSLPPASGQPMIYTSITEAPFPGAENELQFNTRLPLTADWSVPVGFDAGAGVTDMFTFTARWLNTLPGNVGVELEDLQATTTQDLLADSTYTFSGSHTDAEARFMLHFTLLAECPTPEGPTFTNISDNEVDVNWTCNNCTGSETFLIEYGPTGFTPGNGGLPGTNGTLINPATSGMTVTGLDTLTTYDFYVRTICGTSYSENSVVGTVTTLTTQCAVPDQSDIIMITDSSAVVQFNCSTCSGSETVYLEYGLSGFTPGIGTTAGAGGTIVTVTGTNTTIGPLTMSTTYDLYFRVDCGASSLSENSTVQTFTTTGPPCVHPDFPIVSNVGSDQFDVSWTCNDCSGGETFMVEYGPEGFTPGASTNPGAGGTVINPATSPLTISGLDPETVYNVYVRAVCSGPSYSENAGPTEAQTGEGGCPDPTMVAISNVSESGGEVSWLCNNCTGNEAFVIEYGPSGFVPGTDDNANSGTVIFASTSPETLSGLTSNTTYDVYIRTRCSSMDHSANTTVQTFTTTGIPCAEPENVSVTNVDGYQADVNWTCNSCTGGEQFIVEYGPFGFTPGTELTAGTNGTVITPATSPQNIALQPSTQYEVYVRTVCGGGNYSANSAAQPFLSGVACEAPDLPTVLNVTGTTADISWTCNDCYGIGETFSIDYGLYNFPFNGGSFSTIDPATSVHTLTGLTPDTQYSIRIRAYCGQGNYSIHTVLVHFTTLSTNCEADLSIPTATTCANSDLQFTDNSSGAATWLWNFGDGNTSTMQNPVHAYQDTGTYDVTLTVTNGGLCTDDSTISQAITVLQTPVADFEADPTLVCGIPQTVSFTDLSENPDTWAWDFGDQGQSSDQYPDHEYTSLGSFIVELIVTDTVTGCLDSESATIEVNDLPTADFSYSQAGLTITFVNESTNGSSYDWNFGDGESSTDMNPAHTYGSQGNYTVTLTVTNNCGTDSISIIVPVITVGINPYTVLRNTSLYPNPAEGTVNFYGELATNVDQLIIEIVDMQGRTLKSLSVSEPSQVLSVSIDLTDIASGLYDLRVIGTGIRTSTRLSVGR